MATSSPPLGRYPLELWYRRGASFEPLCDTGFWPRGMGADLVPGSPWHGTATGLHAPSCCTVCIMYAWTWTSTMPPPAICPRRPG